MTGCTKHVSSIKGAPRLRPGGVKTKVSQGIASNDWRKRGTAASSTEASTKVHKQTYESSDDASIRLDFETHESFSGPQFRFPKEKRVAWESTVSAPVWQLLSSSSSMSGDDAKEVISVQLKQVKPILASINGETIALPNRFSLDIVAADQRSASPGLAVGELRRLNGFTALRRISSQDSDDLLVELQKVINNNRYVSSPVSSTSLASPRHPKSPEAPSVQGKPKRHSLGRTESSASDTRPNNASTMPSDEEELRFQRMLDRLQNNQRRPSPKPEAGVAVAPCRRIFDPAIMELKVKDEAKVLDNSIHTGQRKEPTTNVFFAQELDQMRKLERQGSDDSGYGSTDKGDGADGRSGVRLRIEQRLNPAAAEFKSAVQCDAAPWLSPKKMSRPPLTNIFPDVMSGHCITPDAVAKDNTSSRPSQSNLASTATAISRSLDGPANNSDNVEASLFKSQPITHTFESTPIQGATLNGLPVVSFIPVTPLPLAIGSSCRPVRPYFPVTTKPRDHDPVKQQLYEAYLEWRKANEPGYHMKCKMRQANRVMRQYQQQQNSTLVKDPANWKAIAERAKAAVGAAAAAAAEEKKRREEKLVRQEVKVKTENSSRDSHGTVRVGT
ncbi:hypothetical protein VTH82DRAFT_2260 [Thermothelomyces myriococcoides]